MKMPNKIEHFFGSRENKATHVPPHVVNDIFFRQNGASTEFEDKLTTQTQIPRVSGNSGIEATDFHRQPLIFSVPELFHP